MLTLSKENFINLESKMKEAGYTHELSVLKKVLRKKEQLPAEEFAKHAIYVVLASGFKQKTAKIKHREIMGFLQGSAPETEINRLAVKLLKIFGNKNKVNAIAKIWLKRTEYRNGYYALEKENLEAKLGYLLSLPHIGPITRNHLARNLGEDVAKYDIWIQRLGVNWGGRKDLVKNINNSKLDGDVKKVCDRMFAHLKEETGLPIGYIDCVLWWSCKEQIIRVMPLQ
jgi:hypothetical protein